MILTSYSNQYKLEEPHTKNTSNIFSQNLCVKKTKIKRWPTVHAGVQTVKQLLKWKMRIPQIQACEPLQDDVATASAKKEQPDWRQR